VGACWLFHCHDMRCGHGSFIPFGIYLKPMAAEFGWTRTEFSLGFSIAALVGALLTPLGGWWIDRQGSRRVVTIGSIALPIVMALFSSLPASYALYLGLCVVLGAVAAVSAPSTVLTIPPQWFERNLGLSLALAGVGFGVGAAVMPYLTGNLVGVVGWRHAWLAMAAIVATIGVINSLALIRDNKDYREARKQPEASSLLGGRGFVEGARTLVFWLLVIPYFLIAIVYTGVTVHLIPMATDRGFTPADGAIALSIVGITSIVSRLVTGILLDRINYVIVGVGLFLALSVGMLLLTTGVVGGSPQIAAGFVGIAVGGEADLMPFVLRRRFGMRAFGRLYGLAYGLFQIGPVIGPLLMGFVFDKYGSYQLALSGFSVASIVAALLLLFSSMIKVPSSEDKSSSTPVRA
jgi:MFS family permease